MGLKATIETTIKPMRWFPQLKGIVGYRKNETYTLEGLLEIIHADPEFMPAEVDEKYDGFRVQIHKVGPSREQQVPSIVPPPASINPPRPVPAQEEMQDDVKVRIWSEDGGDVTSRFPSFVDQAKLLSPKDFVLDAEITGWTGEDYRLGKHIGRSDVSGYAHQKSKPDDSHYYANIFDVLHFDGRDMHSDPLSTRRFILDKNFKTTKNLRPIDYRIAKTDADIADAIKFFRRRPGSEGAMIKSFKSIYPLSGMTNKWIKFKNEADLDAEVIAKFPVKGSKGFNYLCCIRDIAGRLVPVGNTYNTLIDVPVGGIIRISFGNLNKYTDPKTGQVWYNWVFPRPIEAREDKTKPDNNITANAIVAATHGEVQQEPFPKRYIVAIKAYEKGNYEEREWTCPCGCCPQCFAHDWPKFQDIFLEYPDPAKKLQYVIQAHIRGRSVHIDDRRQLDDETMVGMTHFVPKSLSKQPENFEEAKKLYYAEIHPLIVKMMKDPNDKFLSGQKALIPIEWLNVEGKIEKAEPGATRFVPGYMIILEKGDIEYGSLKPYYHEYWYHGKLMNGKYVDRLIENKGGWKKVGEDVASWMFFNSDAIPYILTKRSVEKNFVPPYGIPALPKDIAAHIPDDLKYWNSKSFSERLDVHAKLIDEIKQKKITFSSIKAKFTYSLQDWKGQTVVRLGPTRYIRHLAIDVPGEKGTRHFYVYGDMQESEQVTMIYVPATSKNIMTLEGDVQPGTPWNSSKDTPSTISIIEKEKPVDIVKWDDEKRTIILHDDKLSGVWELRKEEKGSDIWLAEKHTDGFSIEATSKEQDDSLKFETTIESVFRMSSSDDDHEDALPHFIEISGVLFYPGEHTSAEGIKRYYTSENLAKAKLKPRKNLNLCYVNWYHIKDEPYRSGILTDVWFDNDTQIEGAPEKGCLRYRAIIFHRDAVAEIYNKDVKNVSAELGFDLEGEFNHVPVAVNITIGGMAITPTPALKKATISKACTVDREGKRSCKTIQKQ
jgi:hypothetical protein